MVFSFELGFRSRLNPCPLAKPGRGEDKHQSIGVVRAQGTEPRPCRLCLWRERGSAPWLLPKAPRRRAGDAQSRIKAERPKPPLRGFGSREPGRLGRDANIEVLRGVYAKQCLQPACSLKPTYKQQQSWRICRLLISDGQIQEPRTIKIGSKVDQAWEHRNAAFSD